MASKEENEKLPKAKLSKASLRKAFRLFTYMKPDKGKYAVGLLFLALTSATALAFPKLIGDLVNSTGENGLSAIND